LVDWNVVSGSAEMLIQKRGELGESCLPCTLRKKGTKTVTGAGPFQKGTLLYPNGAYWYLSGQY